MLILDATCNLVMKNQPIWIIRILMGIYNSDEIFADQKWDNFHPKSRISLILHTNSGRVLHNTFVVPKDDNGQQHKKLLSPSSTNTNINITLQV